MRIKKIVLIILIVLVSGIIFLFSNQNGPKSEAVSDAFAESFIDKYASVKKTNYSDKQKKDIIRNTRFIVRKGAHFSIYLVLGILVYLLVKCYNISRPFLLAVIICLVLAASDEVHQIFSPGRTARIFDVFVDIFGSSIGMALVVLFENMILKIKNRKGEVKNAKV